MNLEISKCRNIEISKIYEKVNIHSRYGAGSVGSECTD